MNKCENCERFYECDNTGSYDECTIDLAGELLARLKSDTNDWKHPWLKDICVLAVEYLTLDGLADALRAEQIPDEILDIAGIQL